MGQQPSKTYQKLYHVMPAMDTAGCNSPATSWFDKSSKPFATQQDRDQFIYATITVLSQNGALNLEQHDFRLLYSRRDNNHLVARVVAEKEGVIKAQIEPHEGGKDQSEAFKALRRHVEMALDRILRHVPGASGLPTPLGSPLAIAGPSSRTSPPSSPARPNLVPVEVQGPRAGMPSDAPPAYGRAVREWRSEDDAKR